MNRDFSSITIEEIREILNTAMDSGDWHTPSAHDINLHELSNAKSAYGWCNISKHNTFHDKEVWFNINSYSVHIWVEVYVKDKANKNEYRQIYNLQKLTELLSTFQPVETNGK